MPDGIAMGEPEHPCGAGSPDRSPDAAGCPEAGGIPVTAIEEILAQADQLRAFGRADEAAGCCRRVVALVPHHPLALHGLARSAWMCGRPDEAALLLARVLALVPDFAQAALERSHILVNRGRHADAAEVLATAIPHNWEDARLPAILGPWLIALDRLGKADAVLRRAATLAPGSVDAQFGMGALRHREHKLAEAARSFGRAARLSPDMAHLHLNQGSALFDSGRWREAEPCLRKAAVLKPDHGYALFQRARALRRLGRCDDALRPMRAALRLEAPRPDFEAEAAALYRELGDWGTVQRHGRRALALAPALFDGLLACAVAAEQRGSRPDEALAIHERAILCGPGFGEPFTRRAMLLLTRRWGPPPPPRPTPGRPGRRLASTTLGINGRFGNQLLQYGFLRMYAAEHDLDLETPDWLGRHLYDFDDPPPGAPLPSLPEAEHDFAASLNRETPVVHADRNLTGFFCYHTARLARFQAQFRALFRPGARLRPHAEALTARLRAGGETVVALHLRRGDFGWGPFWIAPVDWYLSWLQAIWPDLDRPVLYIATDAPDLVARFAAYRPLTAVDLIDVALAEPIAGAEFFTDFHALCSADVTAISNSTFSFTATMLNHAGLNQAEGARKGDRFFRPDRGAGGLVAYDPWAAEVLL